MNRVLLIEPNLLLARQYKAYLQAHGYTVAACKDAQSAIMAADEAKPRVVVLELLLAGHSGIEFLYEFRSYSEWKDVPVIVFTNLAPHEVGLTLDRQKELGVVACLYKAETPLNKLATTLRRALPLQQKPV